MFSGIECTGLLKIATKEPFGGKKSENLAFLGYISEAKTEEYD